MDADARLLHDIADAVTELVRETPQTEFGEHGGMGASGAPAKRIDMIAEQRVIDLLEEHDSDLNLCSEEVGTVDRGGDRTLVVDPVDGTHNAVRGLPFYCVSLAIAQEGLQDVEAGIVQNIPTGDVYYARRGEGATLNGDPIEVSPYEPRQAIISPWVPATEMDNVRRAVGNTRYVRHMGAAALELALIAQGAMDLYINRRAGLRIVDIAAGVLLVEEAGGIVTTLDGRPPEMELDVRPRTNLVAAGDTSVLSELGVPA